MVMAEAEGFKATLSKAGEGELSEKDGEHF